MVRFYKHLLVLSIPIATLFSCSHSEQTDFSQRKTDFDSNWQFHLNDSLKDQDTISANTAWESLNLPHD